MFFTATDRCNNARHRSSKAVSDNETLYQRFNTAQAMLARQQWYSVKDYCVGLAVMNFVLAVLNFALAFL